MGKIGDLVAKLKLDGSHYDKGLKTAKKNTNTFASGLKSLKAGAVAVWAAIGAAAVKMGKEVIGANQKLGDQFAVLTSEMKAGWDTFARSLASWDFDNFFGRMKEAARAAKELQQARDGIFESGNASTLFEAMNADKMVRLEETFRNTALDDTERIAAGRELLRLRKEAYEIKRKDLAAVSTASVNNFLAGTRAGKTADPQKMLSAFLTSYQSNNAGFVEAVQWLRDNTGGWTEEGKPIVAGNYAVSPEIWRKNYNTVITRVAQMLQQWGIAASKENILAFAELGRVYELQRNDESVKQVVADMVNALKFDSDFYSANRRITAQLDVLETNAGKAPELTKEEQERQRRIKTPLEFVPTIDADELDKIIEQVDAEMIEEAKDMTALDLKVEIDTSALDPAIEKMKSFGAEVLRQQEKLKQLRDSLNEGLKSAITDSLTDGVQSVTDALFQLEGADASNILASIARPFGSFAKTMGSLLIAYGVSMEAFKNAFAVPGAAIAAGAGLIAVGALITSAVSSFNKSQSTAGASSAGASAYAPSTSDMRSEITVNVHGRLNGSDIVLAGQNTLRNWSR